MEEQEDDVESEREFQVTVGQTHMLSIGQLVETVSKLTGERCTPAMIYNYERLGLLPKAARTAGGFRLFTEQDVRRAVLIKRLQRDGMSLSEIGDYFNSQGFPRDLESVEVVDLPRDRREQILKAAQAIFPQRGYSETTIQDIAHEARISSSAIYQYFDSKEELFLALVDSMGFQPALGSLQERIGVAWEKPEDLRSALISLGETFLGIHRQNTETVRLFFAESKRFPELGIKYCERLIRPMELGLQEQFERLIGLGVFRPVDVQVAVHGFYGMFLNVFITENLLASGSCLQFSSEDLVPKMVDIFLQGVVAHPAQEVSGATHSLDKAA
jgi:AcrR family transcriptional regulator